VHKVKTGPSFMTSSGTIAVHIHHDNDNYWTQQHKLHILIHLPRNILFIIKAENTVWNQRTVSLLSHVGCRMQTAVVEVPARPQANVWMHTVLCVKEQHRIPCSVFKT
jgi:hypothetical protein